MIDKDKITKELIEQGFGYVKDQRVTELTSKEFDSLNLCYDHEETEDYFVIIGIDDTIYCVDKFDHEKKQIDAQTDEMYE